MYILGIIVPSRGINSFLENNDDLYNIDNTVTKFERHPNTIAITEQLKESNKILTFQNVSTDKVYSIIEKSNRKKASKSNNIPTMIKNLNHFLLNSFQKTSTVASKQDFSLNTYLYFTSKKMERINLTITLLVINPTFRK